jgi:ribosomal protein L37E
VTGKICMEKCFKCGKENYAPAVATGSCAWCGHDANKKAVTIRKGVKYGPSPLQGAIKLLILQDQLKTQHREFRKKQGGQK